MSTAKLKQELINNIRRLLTDNPNGIEITKLPTTYFNKFGVFAYPEKQGFKTWGEMLGTDEVQKFCVLYDGMKWVKLRDVPNGSPQGGPGTSAPGRKSNDSASNDTKSKPKLVRRPTGSDISANNSLSGKKRAGSASTGDGSKKMKDQFDTKSNSDTDFSEMSHVSISAHNKQKLSRERNKILWIPKDNVSGHLTFNTLILERQVENAEYAMFIDTTFCDRPILEQLMEVKNNIRRVDAARFTQIRSEHNQFEFQKAAIFQNGAAIKMANIDALMGMQLSNPKGPDGSTLIKSNELLYFVDVYGGPGGCAEYFLWKKKWQAKGYGITLRAGMDYNLQQAEHFPRESFETFYGDGATEGTGDISKPYNLSKFVSFVKESTDQQGVHVMVASGGERTDTTDEDQKEIRCKYTFLAEFLIALQVIREGGHFVCRIYDMYTPFTVGLIYMMYRTFEQVAVFKPESSLPASSEKYLLCKWKRPNFQCTEISNYLSECHKIDWLSKRARKQATENFAEITHLLSVDRMKNSYRFMDYIRRTNADLGQRQYHETMILATSIRDGCDPKYVHQRHMDITEKCLNLWGIPDRVREKPKYSKATTPEIRAMKLLTPYSHDFFGRNEREGEVEMSMGALVNDLKNPKEWCFMAVGRERGFFMSLGGDQIFKYEDGGWKRLTENVELMNNTLVYADLVDEFEFKGAKQTMWTGFHIIDALILGGKDVRELPSNERSDMIAKYAKSMNKASRDDLASIRPKLTYEMKDINKFFSSINEHKVRGRNGELVNSYLGSVDNLGVNQTQFLIGGVLFIKKYKANFVPADFRFCVQNRVYWKWSDKVVIKVPKDFVPGPIEHHDEQEDMDEDNVVPVHAVTLLQHLHERKQE